MKRYQVYFNDKANINEVAQFDTLEDAIKEADSHTVGKELCTGDPDTDLAQSFYMSVVDTTLDPETAENMGVVYETKWYWE